MTVEDIDSDYAWGRDTYEKKHINWQKFTENPYRAAEHIKSYSV